MKKSITLLIGLLFCCSPLLLTAQDGIPSRPTPQRLVNDFAHIFSANQVDTLETMLRNYYDTTTTQIVIVTVNSLSGYDVADFTTQLGISWGIGKKDVNNGVVVLIKPKLGENDRGSAHISVGYGLEGVIPDAVASRVYRMMLSYFKENDYYTGVYKGANQLMSLASGEQWEMTDDDDLGLGGAIIVFLFLCFLILPTVLYFRGIIRGTVSVGGGGYSSGSYSSSSSRSYSSGYSSSSGSSFRFGGGSFGGGGAGGSW